MSAESGPVATFDYAYRPTYRTWSPEKPLGARLGQILTRDVQKHREILEGFSEYDQWFSRIPTKGDAESREPFWLNGWYESLDAMSLYYLIASRRPSVYLEVGSGNSTKFARRAIEDHGLKTSIVSIDPHPRAEVDGLCDMVVRKPCEQVDPRIFHDLGPNDLLLVDNSHRSFQSSDVTFFFTEVLAGLNPELVFGIHDIFLPRDYPEVWLGRFYNEQYLLMAYLLGGAESRAVELPIAHLVYSGLAKEIVRPSNSMPLFGGMFWMGARRS